MLQSGNDQERLDVEKPRWHKALDNLRQFASLQARLEGELSDAHRELAQVREDYLHLGARCSALASERDALRRRVVEAEQYFETPVVARQSLAGDELQDISALRELLSSREQELQEAQSRHIELEAEFQQRDQIIEALQAQLTASQAREAGLASELEQAQQRPNAMQQNDSPDAESYRVLMDQLDALRTSAADAADQQRKQVDDLRRRLVESRAFHAELSDSCRERDEELETLRDESVELRARLTELEGRQRDSETLLAERNQSLDALNERLTQLRAHEAGLEAQNTELKRSHGALERAQAAAADEHRQQLDALQRHIDTLQAEQHATLEQVHSRERSLAAAQVEAESNRALIAALERRLEEAARGREIFHDRLLELEHEHQQLLANESELTESLKKTRNQLHQAEHDRETLAAGRRRERRILWVTLAVVLVLLSLLLLNGLDALREAPVQSSGVVAPVETGSVSLPESACPEWGVTASDCPHLDAGALDESVVRLESGVRYRAVKEGTGPVPQLGDEVTMSYVGRLLDGTEFDNSASYGGPVTVRLDELIPGLQEALQRMAEGARWLIYIPAQPGYPVPGVSVAQAVVFDIELLATGMQAETSG
ncbi:MAG: FKBP-type peptidyl-prolyl cis-trans isomerase [Thiogranum sp.]|nr:FKBP-type peptidyl-prolyl cis-trans isomerase [Thiogranum sp.]